MADGKRDGCAQRRVGIAAWCVRWLSAHALQAEWAVYDVSAVEACEGRGGAGKSFV